MGNFSVSHYSRLVLKPDRLEITYVLDLAEIPTFELFTDWGNSRPDAATVTKRARLQAEGWVRNLAVTVNGRAVHPTLQSSEATISDGAGGMPVLRVSMEAGAIASPGELSYEDKNYATRTGWKEIVIRKSPDVRLASASEGEQDLSHGLTVYPADLTLAPPQVLSASARWEINPGDAVASASRPAARTCADAGDSPGCGTQPSKLHPTSLERSAPRAVGSAEHPTAAESRQVASLKPADPPAPQKDFGSFAQSQPTAPGTVVRGDFLSRMLREKRFGWTAILLGLLAAFGLGCLHALSPGHGKTIVAAYLVGSRGTLRHALFLGFMVTFTHTASVFLLGLGVLFFQKYVVPDRIIPILGTVSGLSIVSIGLWLLYQRSKALLDTAEPVSARPVAVHHAKALSEQGQEPEPELVGASIGSSSKSLPVSKHSHGDGPHSHPHEHTHPEHHHHLLDADFVHSHAAGHSDDSNGYTHPHNHGHDHHHDHAHDHDHHPVSGQVHDHHHHHDHDVEHHHRHDHPDGVFVHTHTHNGHTHSHAIPSTPGRVTLGSLIALGASGGLVPCPSALVLLLSAIALGHTALGLFLLAGFSAGLALVLMVIGALVLYARHLLPKSESADQHPLLRLLPVFSAVVVIVLGLLMTLTAIGLIQPIRFMGA